MRFLAARTHYTHTMPFESIRIRRGPRWPTWCRWLLFGAWRDRETLHDGLYVYLDCNTYYESDRRQSRTRWVIGGISCDDVVTLVRLDLLMDESTLKELQSEWDHPFLCHSGVLTYSYSGYVTSQKPNLAAALTLRWCFFDRWTVCHVGIYPRYRLLNAW